MRTTPRHARDTVLLNSSVTIDEAANRLQIIHGSAYEIIHNRLRFHIIRAKQLTMLHKQMHLDICRQHMNCYGNDIT
jgi:hypothetical protein